MALQAKIKKNFSDLHWMWNLKQKRDAWESSARRAVERA